MIVGTAAKNSAKAFADSGIQYVAAALSYRDDTGANSLVPNPWDNESFFRDQRVSAGNGDDDDNPMRQGKFTILSIRDPQDQAFSSQPYRFGVTDEAGKLNLNAMLTLAGKNDTVCLNMLMKLPNMTDDVANSILDWIDSSSSTPRTNGAKDEYYPTLPTPYHVKNGPLDSLDELLSVKGVTPQLLYGNDRSRNGTDADQSGSGVDVGWQQYLTLYSREPNTDSKGNARINLNDSDLKGLYTKLQTTVDPNLAFFLVCCRMYPPDHRRLAAIESGRRFLDPVGDDPVHQRPCERATRALPDPIAI